MNQSKFAEDKKICRVEIDKEYTVVRDIIYSIGKITGNNIMSISFIKN